MPSVEACAGKRVLITGGLGMLGSTIAHRLVACGAQVTIADAMLPLYGGNLFNLHGIEDRVRVNYADIRDEGAMNQLVRGQDIIFDLAAQVSYTDSQEMPLLDVDINCRGHLVVLEACRHFNPEAKVIFTGSRMQYGKTLYNPVDAKHPMLPLSIYGVHKMTGEAYCQMYFHTHGIRTVAFRIANPYGPRQQMKHSKYGIVNWFIRLAMDEETIRVFGDGQQIRDYVYVDDIAEALILSGVSEATDGEVYNLGSGVETRFIDMARMVVETVGRGKIEQVPWPDNYSSIETGDYVMDIAKVYDALGWQPKVTLAEGIERAFRYYSVYREHYWQK